MFIFRFSVSKRPDPTIIEKFKNKLILCRTGKIWMDDELIKEYLQKVHGNSLFESVGFILMSN